MNPKNHPKAKGETGRLLLGAVVILLVTIGAYLPVFRAGFVWDDRIMIFENMLVRSPDGLRNIWFSPHFFDCLPVTSTFFWVGWKIWGAKALYYHLCNLLLHGFGSILLWRVLAKLKMPGAWLAAMIFAIHPVAVASVAWVSEVKNTLSLLLALTSVLFYLRFDQDKKPGWFALSLLAFLCALMAKPSVVVLPVLLLFLAWWRRGRISMPDVLKVGPFFVISILIGLLTVLMQSQLQYGKSVQVEGILARLAEAGWAFWFYLGKSILPASLCAIYPRWELLQVSPVDLLPSLAVLGLLIACWKWRHSWGRIGLLFLLCFGVLLLPVLGMINMYFLPISRVADHLQYLALIPVCALAGWIILGKKDGTERRILAVALIVIFAVLTYRHALAYTSSETLWRDNLAKNPRSWVAWTSLGMDRSQEGQNDQAIEMFQHALEARPDYELARLDLGNAFLNQGRLGEAITEYETALKTYPNYGLAHLNLGLALCRIGQAEKGLAHVREAIRLEPEDASAYNNLGALLDWNTQLDEAIRNFRKAIQLSPNYADAHKNLGMALARKEQFQEAVAEYQRSMKLKPDSDGYYLMGLSLRRLDRKPEATEAFQHALKLNPANHKAEDQLRQLASPPAH